MRVGGGSSSSFQRAGMLLCQAGRWGMLLRPSSGGPFAWTDVVQVDVSAKTETVTFSLTTSANNL